MNLVRQYEKCRGLSFPAIGKWKIEFWYAPAGYEIREHSHPNEDIKLIMLFGHNIMFERNGLYFYGRIWHSFWRVFNIRAGDNHSFKVSKWPLIFMNIEHWLTTPTSACDDFKLKGDN